MDKREKGVKEGRINVADSPCERYSILLTDFRFGLTLDACRWLFSN